jgi:uncharacterized protein YraI
MQVKLFASAAVAAVLALSGAASAQTMARATTDLNVRSGPGPQHAVTGLVNAEGEVTVNGCIEGSKWCRVTHNGQEGWVYSDYLVADVSGSQVVLTERRADVGVPVVTYEGAAPTATTGTAAGGTAGVTTGAVGGAIIGALIGGPVGAAVGGIAGAGAGGVTGAATGAAIDPEPAVRTFVTSNPVDPVYLDGEVVVGARLPENVELREIPQSEYRYVNVNGQPVLVRAEDRQIVYVVRP